MADPQRHAPIKEPKADRDPPAKEAPGRGQTGKAGTDRNKTGTHSGTPPENPANVPNQQRQKSRSV